MQSSFLGFVGFLWSQQKNRRECFFHFSVDRPTWEGTWWVHDLPDLVITGAVCSTPRTPQRFSGAECVTAFGARCVFFRLGVGCWGWMVKEVGWVLGWICSAFSFRVFECWEKKDTWTNLVKHCYWMLLTLGPCHFKLMIENFWLSSKVRGIFCWREEDLIVLPTIGYTWISLSWFFTDCTMVSQYKAPFGKVFLHTFTAKHLKQIQGYKPNISQNVQVAKKTCF